MVTKSKIMHEEKVDALTLLHKKAKSENTKFHKNLNRLKPLLPQKQSMKINIEQKKALQEQKLEELEHIANGLKMIMKI